MAHSLKTEVEKLKQQVKRFEKILEALGLPISPWVSPQQAADILSTSRARISREIKKAEHARLNRIKYDLIWGVHYRKNGDNWQVNPLEFEKVIFAPPEQRPYVELLD